MIPDVPKCEVCHKEMEMGGFGSKFSKDPRSYRCETCFTKVSI